MVLTSKKAIPSSALKSAKKILEPGDVIISRLRPYLRQVALVDPLVTSERTAGIACSTEFYVLRSRTESETIAYLVPFLLTTAVQAQLSASQEGGHHPRFAQRALEGLVVSDDMLRLRTELSANVESAIETARKGHLEMQRALEGAEGIGHIVSPEAERKRSPTR
jgi:hypothetical protein